MPETNVSRALERVLNCKGYSMKKLMLLSACLLAVPALHAEQMQFVTTMSAPVGNFAHLDAADSTHVTCVGKKDGDSCIGGYLNFCNTRSNVGNIVIKGANAYLKQVNVQNGATLGSTNTPEYRLSDKLTVENGGTVTAGRVMANNVTFKDTNFHKSNVTGTLYGSDIAAMGGKADNMEIASTAKINKSAQTAANLGQEMEWSNQYSKDYDSSGNAKSNGKSYTSFLLKSKGESSGGCEPTNGMSYEIGCGGAQTGKITFTWNQSTCSYDKEDTCQCDENHPYKVEGYGCVECNTPGFTWKCFDTYCSLDYKIRYCNRTYYDYQKDVCYATHPLKEESDCLQYYGPGAYSHGNKDIYGNCVPDGDMAEDGIIQKWNGRDYCSSPRCGCTSTY